MVTPKLPSQHLDLVARNFPVIYVAAHQEKTKSLDLVPALFGNQLYCSTMGKGRLLRIIYVALSCFIGKGFRQRRLTKIIQKTQESFQMIEDFRQAFHDMIYENYLHHKLNESPCSYSNQAVNKAREELKKFYYATHPLSKLVRDNKNQKLNQFLKTFFKNIYEKGKTPFYCSQTFKTVKDYVKMIEVEGFIGNELPLNLFQKLSVKAENTTVKKDVLEFFVRQVKKAKKQGTFQINVLHRALRAVIRHLKGFNEEQHDLRQLEVALIKEGCPFLDEFDTRHIEWRSHLKDGAEYIKDKERFYFLDKSNQVVTFTLGKPIKGIEKDKDRTLVFEMIDSKTSKKIEDKLLVIASNKLSLEFSELMGQQYVWGMEGPKILYIHPKGKYAIVERLPHAIDSIDWKSNLLGNLSEEDKKFVEPLRQQIQFFLDEKSTPRNFKAEYLKFDDRGQLKFTKDCVRSGKIDYMALEDVAFALAHGRNLPVYQYIIEPLRLSKLGKGYFLPFFKDSVKRAFKKYDLPIRTLAKIRKIDDEAIIRRGEKLYSYVKRMRDIASDTICEKYANVNKEKLRKHMCTCLMKLYDGDKTFGRFWDNMKSEELVHEVEKDPQLFRP